MHSAMLFAPAHQYEKPPIQMAEGYQQSVAGSQCG
jgi:hypothetical protein